MGANPDSTLLSWITAEVNQALSVVREQLARFSAEPGDAAVLRACPDHLHQVSGALRMIGLSGATRFCEAIEGSFPALNGERPSAQAMETIDRAVLLLKEFVDGLERGQPNVPLRLYPIYRELGSLQGKPSASEKELFFPDLSPQAPAHPSPNAIAEEELCAFLQAQRVQFQRGLLAWLRNQPGGIEEMRRSLDALYQVAAQLPEPRSLWWISSVFIETLAANQDTEWLASSKPLCNKIDFQIRDLGAGARTVNEALPRELLYALAKCSAAIPRTTEIRQLYQLDSLFPAPAESAPDLEMNSEWLEAALYDMHSRLEALKSAWVQYVSGEQKTAGRFRELVASFKARAAELGNQHMIKLLDAIALVAKHLPDPYPSQNQFMVIEMASAFLLVENVIDHFTSPAPDLEQQIVILGGWLLDSAKGGSTGEPPAGLRGDLVQQIGALQLRAQVAKEITTNLQHMEQVLDAFARDPGKRDTLAGLKPYARQVHGALKVLGFERAAEVVSICENMIAACSVVELDKAAEEMDWIAEGLSSVGFYLDPCRHGRDPAEQAIDLFFQRFSKRIDKPEPGRWADKTSQLRPSQAAASRGSGDPELLGIFLEEADEVLRNIDAAVPLCRQQPNDLESLTVMRRGFHTLKGSGRMVGLMDLGEVAWEIEQLLNKWLEKKQPASAELLAFIADAGASFSDWIKALREGSLTGEIDGAGLVERARRLKAGEAAAQASAPEPTFLEIYSKEAAEHVAALEAEFARWRAAPGTEASHEFMRAAHTLHSSSRTAEFPAIAELAAALEQWMPFARQVTATEDAEIVAETIARLREMTQAVSRGEAPSEAGAQIGRLKGLTARLGSNPPPPLETTTPVAPVAPVAQAAPAPAPKPDGRAKRVMRDDIDEQLLPVFLEEAQQLVPAIGGDLRDWKANPADEKVSQSLRRALHTLKGSARMAGAIRLGELTHIMESRIDAAIEAKDFPSELFAELEEKMDRLSLDVERMGGAVAKAAVQPEATAKVAGPAAPAAAAPGPSPAPRPTAAAMLRINADTLDQLINEAGEVAIARSRVEAELRLMRQALNDLSESIARLRAQLREVEIQADSQMQSRLSVLEERQGDYDPLEFDRYTRLQELTRLMAESLNDVLSIQQALLRNLGESDSALLQQARTSRDVQQELMRMRAVPFATLNERLFRIVRQTARELDKKAELYIEGADVDLDRSILERIGAPLEHMLRNALAHGLEMPAERLAAGKAETGRISITLRQESNEIALIVADDGAGIDAELLHRKAMEKGIVPAGATLDENERLQLVFASGLSTAETVTELSGRGVGMDVVRNEISAIGGRIDIATTRSAGTTFTIYLPLTLAVTQAVLVRAGGSLYSISTAMVEQVLRLKAEDMSALYAAKQVEFQGRFYPLYAFQHLFGAPGANDVQAYNSVLLLRSGIQRIALQVDELLGNQEIVVKHIGAQLARLPWIAGATVLADGSIVPIVNPVVLAQRARGAIFDTTTLVPPLAAGEEKPSAPLIMIVDDSLTVRKITSRLLEREGYQVLTAKDGLDALEQLRDTLPAVLLVDIEMPRMDGFDLTRNVRGDPRTKDIPIIIISSRTAEKHRNQAASLGVNAFLGKPYQEAELLQHISAFAGAAVH
ncbi:MAG: response regulator [Betaproteobacteria bacterium]|nr:MAG: response regulator [Betaproteobacteria bacterium]